MAVKKKNRKRKGRGVGNTGCIIAIIIAVIIIVLLIVGVLIVNSVLKAGIEMSERISEDVEQNNYPLEYTEFVEKYSDEFKVPESVILAMIKVESDFDENAVSQAGACGLMQLMPDTFTWLAQKLGEEVTEAQIFDPETNIRYGTYYVSRLYSQLGNWDNVYAAYNAGPTKVAGWLSDPQYSENGELKNIPYPETEYHIFKLRYARAKYIELYNLGE